MKYELRVVELDVEDIETIVSGVRTGGVSCCWLDNIAIEGKTEPLTKQEIEYYDTTLAMALLEGDYLKFTENNDDGKYYLNYKQFLRGINQFIDVRKCSIEYIFNGGADASDVDCIIQYGLFGEILFS